MNTSSWQCCRLSYGLKIETSKKNKSSSKMQWKLKLMFSAGEIFSPKFLVDLCTTHSLNTLPNYGCH